ncbi:hypothetical protein PGC35_01550 [Psychrobacillus sp. PGGUH221]|uniref:glycosyltransferase family 2 protein n=1 Tax=Psychrobacillus sp. PGGUH221 TaxID=3020058 RepID=UPI0035C729F9
MKKPIVFIIFNRPETTAIVFEEIRKYKPMQLFIIGDGPRLHKEGEEKLCAQARAIIQVDWECDIRYIFSNENLGCQKRISSGLDLVFEQVEDAIILEDDCVPHEDFFRFCEEMLDYYKNDDRIMAISGDNFQKNDFDLQESYYYSIYPHCWGWATWRQAWRMIDVKMKEWPKYRNSDIFNKMCYDPFFQEYWTRIYDDVYEGKIDSWAYPWTFSCWYNGGLSVIPKKNLVSNIGFTENATHTHENNELQANLPRYKMKFPLKHPNQINRNFEADFYTSEYIYNIRRGKIESVISKMKANLFHILLDESRVLELIQNNVYIFGIGKLGRDIQALLKLRGINVSNFVVTNTKESQAIINGLNVIPIEAVNSSEVATIIVTIEGEHDKKVIEEMESKYNNTVVKVLSWKKII